MSTGPIFEYSRSDELQAESNILNGNGKGIKGVIEENTEETGEESEDPYDIASREEFFDAIENAYRSDKDLQVKIQYCTLSKIRFYAFKDEVNEQSAEDVIQNVIELISHGIRKWNKTKFPNVINYLFVAIHSYIRNESKKKQKWKCEDIYDKEGKLKENQVEKFSREAIAEDLSEEFFSAKLEDLINKLETKLELNGDDDAYCVFDEILKNDTTEFDDDAITNRLGLSVSKVKLAKRRIRYAANQLMKK